MGEKSGFEDDIPHEEIKDTDIPKYSDELEKESRYNAGDRGFNNDDRHFCLPEIPY